MTARGYVGDIRLLVGAWLGTDLTAEQAARATLWLETAEAVIDRATGQPFATGPVVSELQTPDGPLLYLRQAPVASLTSIAGRHTLDATPTVLVSGRDYELRDARTGLVVLGPAVTEWPPQGQPHVRTLWYAPYAYYQISYTPGSVIPTVIQDATAALLAEWVVRGAPGSPTTPIIADKEGDVETRWATPVAGPSSSGLPPPVAALLAPYLGRLVFA